MINKDRVNEFFTGSIARQYKTNDKKEIQNIVKKQGISARILNTNQGQFLTVTDKKNRVISQANLLYFLTNESDV